MSECGQMKTDYTSRGTRYEMTVRHDGLGKYQVVRGDDKYVVEQKARAKMQQWDDMWQRKQRKALAAERTQEAQKALEALDRVLAHTLDIDDTVDWEALKDFSEYTKPRPSEPSPLEIPSEPSPLEIPSQLSAIEVLPEPRQADAKYEVKLGVLDKLLSYRKKAKEREAEERWAKDHQEWEKEKQRLLEHHRAKMEEYETALTSWEEECDAFLKAQAETNAAVDAQRKDYLAGDDPGAIVEYCVLVLSNSEYPDYFPQSNEVDYNPQNRILIVDYQLPSLSDLPTLREVKYDQSRDEFTEKHVSQAQLNRTFNSLLYQIVLRTIHELYEADQIDALASIVFNGYVQSLDAATGQEVNPCVASVQAGKEEFERINLANVDPKTCFRGLKGIGSIKLQSMTPIAPILRLEREDARFIEGYGVVDGLEEGDNLAAMDWEDFEHFIREVFEKEFGSAGGEVKVTRASRDGGVDAVAFDPDPIRGGKIIIQAKRYTGTVGVSAVRDLYGTVVNEGANKGIIVTTSHYGADAYEFAKGKPLVLIDGNNLLHLLEKHGHKARIDLMEAKKILAEREAEGRGTQ